MLGGIGTFEGPVAGGAVIGVMSAAPAMGRGAGAGHVSRLRHCHRFRQVPAGGLIAGGRL